MTSQEKRRKEIPILASWPQMSWNFSRNKEDKERLWVSFTCWFRAENEKTFKERIQIVCQLTKKFLPDSTFCQNPSKLWTR